MPRRDPDEKEAMGTFGYRLAHPDFAFQQEALRARDAGDPEKAFELFRIAAWWGDKGSQGVLAEMFWEGEGVEADRAAAYAWMDLAAERGYPLMLSWRERYWADLEPVERQRAMEIGAELYAEYGDEVAKPRLARQMAKARRMAGVSRSDRMRGRIETGRTDALPVDAALFEPKSLVWQGKMRGNLSYGMPVLDGGAWLRRARPAAFSYPTIRHFPTASYYITQ